MNNVAHLYKITNTMNDMVYIGVTKNPNARMNAHACLKIPTKSIIKNAIKKYGRDKFTLQVLVTSTQEYCYELERKAIEAYNTLKPNGYNICTGGRGATGIFGELNGMYGKKGEAHPNFGKVGYNLGKKLSEETKEKMRQAHLGRKKSAEHCAKMKEISSNRSPELLAKMREARNKTFARKRLEKAK